MGDTADISGCVLTDSKRAQSREDNERAGVSESASQRSDSDVNLDCSEESENDIEVDRTCITNNGTTFNNSVNPVNGTKIENLVCNIETLNSNQQRPGTDGRYKTIAILLLSVSIAITFVVLYLSKGDTAKTHGPTMTVTIQIGNLTQFFNYNPVGQQSGSNGRKGFVLTFINVTHWQHLTEPNIDVRLFNYVLATTWSQWLCLDMRKQESLADYRMYSNETTQFLGETSAHFNEYEFISRFRNLSMVRELQAEFLPPPDHLNTSRRDIDIKFISFLETCVYFLNLNQSDTIGSDCKIVQSFNEIRNSIFDLNNQKLTLFLSEISSNVFTFVSFLSMNFPVQSDDDKKAIAVTKQSVFNYMIDSLDKIEKNFIDAFSRDVNSLKALKYQIINQVKESF